jgi:hypothetical protein
MLGAFEPFEHNHLGRDNLGHRRFGDRRLWLQDQALFEQGNPERAATVSKGSLVSKKVPSLPRPCGLC